MEALNRRSIVFFDIDGTLCRYEGFVSEEVKESFCSLHNKGHVLFLCTGRSPKDIGEDILTLGFDGIISCMGAVITIGETLVENRYIPPEMMLETVGAMIERKIPVLILGIDELLRSEQMIPSRLETGVVHSKADLIKNGCPVYVSSLDIEYPEVSSLGEVRGMIERHSELVEYNVSSGQTRLKGVNKAAAIRKVLAMREYMGMKSYAIGDSLNDLEMLRCVDVGIAMGDAPEEVRVECKWVTSKVEENGVCVALKHFDLI